MSEIILSTKQKEIVNTINGSILVKASPGSGKTRVVIERIKKLLKTTRRIHVLALTFSNLAAEEIRERLEEESSLKDLVSHVTIGTLHSFCLDLVQKYKSILGFKQDLTLFEDSSERKLILRNIFAHDLRFKHILFQEENTDRILNDYLERISKLKRQFILPDMCLDQSLTYIYDAYNECLTAQNALDFDDILFFAYRILSENPRIAKLYTSIYKYICVDEAQDLNFAQYTVLRTLCSNGFNNIMLVGDDKQSIYGFNGSDSRFMTEHFVKDFSPTIHVLNENYRSAASIIDFANTIANSNIIPSNCVYIGEMKAFSFQDEDSEAQYIVSKILELLKNGHKDIQGKLALENFAIIARNKYLLTPLESMLKDVGLAYFFKRSTTGIVNESDYMKIFDWIMRLFINPKDIIHLNKLKIKLCLNDITLSENVTIAKTQLQKLLEKHQLYGISQSMNYWTEDNHLDLTKALTSIENNLDNLSQEEHYLIINDIQQWKHHWEKYKKQVSSEYFSLKSFRSYVALGKTQDTSADIGISLLTAHMSKGLQYDVVFVMGLSDGTFPDYRAIRAGQNAIEQEQNNFYVAVTRAKRLCYLTYPRKKRCLGAKIVYKKNQDF